MRLLKNIILTTVLCLPVTGWAQIHGPQLVVKGGLYIQPGAELHVWGDLNMSTQQGIILNNGTVELEGNLIKQSESKFDKSGTGALVFRNDSVNTTEIQHIEGSFSGSSAVHKIEIDNRSTDPYVFLKTGDFTVNSEIALTKGSLCSFDPGAGAPDVYKVVLTNSSPGAITGNVDDFFIDGTLRWKTSGGNTYLFPVGSIGGPTAGIQPFELSRLGTGDFSVDASFNPLATGTDIGTTTSCDVGTPPSDFSTPDGIPDLLTIDCVAGKWDLTGPSNEAFDISFFPSPELLNECDIRFHFLARDGSLLDNCPENGFTALNQNSFGVFDIPIVTNNGSSIALPIELAFLDAVGSLAFIDVKWQTLTEINSAGFELERSTNGQTFESVTWVEGRGNSETPTDYLYQDIHVVKDVVYYYRLKMVDLDGAYRYSEIVTVMLNTGIENSETVVFPNPLQSSKAKLNFLMDHEARIWIEIYNYLGVQIYRDRMVVNEGINSIQLPKDLKTGTYQVLFRENGFFNRATLMVLD